MVEEDMVPCEFPGCKKTSYKRRFCDKHINLIHSCYYFMKRDNNLLKDLWGRKLSEKELAIINKAMKKELEEIEEKYLNRRNSCRDCVNFIRIDRWGSAFIPQGVCGMKKADTPYLSSSEATSCPNYEKDYDKTEQIGRAHV